MIERAPFASVTDALYYLFNPERATVDRPPASRLADKRRGEPGSLSGEEGTATAARASAMLERRLTPLQVAILACRYAPSRIRCECRSNCCSGKKMNQRWREAVTYVAHDAVYRASPRGETMHVRFVSAVLLREYGKEKATLTDIGSGLGMSTKTCADHRRRVLDWLFHQPGEQTDSSDVEKRPVGQEVGAFALAEDVLVKGGFVDP